MTTPLLEKKRNSMRSPILHCDTPNFPFILLHGAGNAFTVIEDLEGGRFPDENSKQHAARKICDRHFGLGCDGVLFIRERHALPSDSFTIEMYNADGSHCGMCGNGIRCVTRALFLLGLVALDTESIRYVIEGREIVCHTSNQGCWVRVDMGKFSLSPESIPLIRSHPHVSHSKEGLPFQLTFSHPQFKGSGYCVSMGNPHCVFFVENISAIPLEVIGPPLEHHAALPQRANIEFAQVYAPNHVRMRVWERGVGITLACGTGACAVTVAGIVTGVLDSTMPILVDVDGGSLKVEVALQSQKVYLNGPAQEIASGVLSDALCARRL